MSAKTVFLAFLLALVGFGLGAVSTRYVSGSIADEMRHALAREMRQSIARELKAIENKFEAQSSSEARESALRETTSFAADPTAARVEDTLPYGPHGRDLLAALRRGGYTLVFRHPAQDRIDGDSLLAFDLLTLTKAGLEHPTFTKGLCLNAHGRAEAWLIGKAMRALTIPVGKIWSSPVCRARELAEIAFGRVDHVMPALGYGAMFTSPAEADDAMNHYRALLETPPAPGTNNVLTGSLEVLNHLPDLKVTLNRSDTAVFRRSPDGRLVYAARLALADWVKWMERVDLTQPVHRRNRAVAQRAERAEPLAAKSR